jgi:hypothetical protein
MVHPYKITFADAMRFLRTKEITGLTGNGTVDTGY